MAGKSRKNLAENLHDALFPPRLEDLEGLEGFEGLQLEGAEGPAYDRILETICGVADDSQPVEQYNGSLGVTTQFVLDHQAPVAQVQWNSNLASRYANPGNVNGARFGTGAMISADLFLTCAHLFDGDGGGWIVPRQPGTNTPITSGEIATNMHLNFNYQVDSSGNPRPVEEFAISQLVEFRLGGLDMAICRIAGNPGNRFGSLPVDTVDAIRGDVLAIIGHPAGVPKRVEAGPLTDIVGDYLHYNDIDTLGGNSGSPILSARTGRIVGVHTNGGCTPSSPNGGGANRGVAIGRIRAASPTLQALGVGGGTSLAADTIGSAVAADILGTALSDDLATTRSWDIRTPLALDRGTGWRDILDTSWRDQINTGWRDTVGTIVGETVFDPGRVFDPVVNPAVRPFVQAGTFQQLDPRQGGGGEAGTGPTGAALLASALEALEQASAAQQQSLAALENAWAALAALLDGEA